MSNGVDPPLGKRVGSRIAGLNGDDAGTDRREHVIESPGVLASAVADHEPDRPLEAHEEVAGGLAGPYTGRVGGDLGEVHPSGLYFDEEQDVVAAQATLNR